MRSSARSWYADDIDVFKMVTKVLIIEKPIAAQFQKMWI